MVETTRPTQATPVRTTQGVVTVDGAWSELTVIQNCDLNTTCLTGGVLFKISTRKCNNPK